jgi:hypothetical protein
VLEEAGEGVGLRPWKVGEERADTVPQQFLGGAVGAFASAGERERLAPAVAGRGPPFDEPGLHERGDQLRDGGTGYARAAGKLSARHLSAGDRAEREVLRDRQRRLVRGEKTLDPSGC